MELSFGYTDADGDQWEAPSECFDIYTAASAVMASNPELWKVKDAKGKDRTDETAIVLVYLRRAYHELVSLSGLPREVQARRFELERENIRLLSR